MSGYHGHVSKVHQHLQGDCFHFHLLHRIHTMEHHQECQWSTLVPLWLLMSDGPACRRHGVRLLHHQEAQA